MIILTIFFSQRKKENYKIFISKLGEGEEGGENKMTNSQVYQILTSVMQVTSRIITMPYTLFHYPKKL